MEATASQNPRYEVHESPPFMATLGFGLQFSLIASATLLVTPVIVARESGSDDSYMVWMVFASLVVVGVATLLQVRRLGPVGAGAVLPMFTAAVSIPFCISAVVDGGPATLTTLVLVMAGYLIVVTATLFVEGFRSVIQTKQNSQRVVAAGVCFWIGAAFQFGLFSLPNLGPVLGALLKSGITTGGLAAIVLILYLEFTNPRRMRFRSQLHVDALPGLNEFMARFAARRGWNTEMKDRPSAVAEETLLTLAPLDLEGKGDTRDERRLVVLASSDGPVADLEFIGGETERTSRNRSGSSSHTARKLRLSMSSRFCCCGASPRPYGISSLTIPTSSRSASSLPRSDEGPLPDCYVEV